jgi:acyl-coenzyme A thioesterase PaaI-like protein
LTAAEDTDKAAIYGVWAKSLAELVSYRYLGCRSVLHDGFDATGRMPLRSDMRPNGSLLAAPAAIAMLDTAGIAIDRHWQLALTHVDISLVGGARGVSTLGVQGSMTRAARSQVFTECQFVDADDPDTIIGFGTADWTVIAPTATGFDYIDPGPGIPDTGDLPPLHEAYGAVVDGNEFTIAEVTPKLGGPVLHHGPILVTLEAAALAAVAPCADGVEVESLSARLVRAGKRGPLRASGRTLSQSGTTTVVRSDLYLDSPDGELIATATLRLRLL